MGFLDSWLDSDMSRRIVDSAISSGLVGTKDINPDTGKKVQHDYRILQSGEALLKSQKEPKKLSAVGYSRTPMIDWDWPDASHAMADAITIRNLGDATSALADHAYANNKQFSLYMTPGGVHAFDLSTRATPRQYFSDDSVLQMAPDPYYMKLSKVAGYQLPENLRAGFKEGLFYNRVTPKLDRTDDFIGFYLGNVGEGPILNHNAKMVQLSANAIENARRLPGGTDPLRNDARRNQILDQIETVSPALTKRWTILKALGR